MPPERNAPSKSEYLVHLVGGRTDEIAKVTAEPRHGMCHVQLQYENGRFEASASDYFEAFCQIRQKLEGVGLTPFCYGASLSVYPSGMCRDMGAGMFAYRLAHGRSPTGTDLVRIFDSGPDVIPSTVANQKAHFEGWRQTVRS